MIGSSSIQGLAPLTNNTNMTEQFHAPDLKRVVVDILHEIRERPLRRFVEGEPIGVLPEPRRERPLPSRAVVTALRHQRTVWRWNREIKRLRVAGLGLAQHMPYLILDRDQERVIDEWRGA